jgi:hypothetical protein
VISPFGLLLLLGVIVSHMIRRIYQCCKPRRANQSEILMSVSYITGDNAISKLNYNIA